MKTKFDEYFKKTLGLKDIIFLYTGYKTDKRFNKIGCCISCGYVKKIVIFASSNQSQSVLSACASIVVVEYSTEMFQWHNAMERVVGGVYTRSIEIIPSSNVQVPLM